MSSGVTKGDLAVNAAHGLLKGLPFVGESLAQFIFGSLEEIRFRRLQNTLSEVVSILRENGHNPILEREEFVNLLQDVAPEIARSVSEERRVLLRNLLSNAVIALNGSKHLHGADLAAKLILEIDPPGLVVLSELSKCKSKNSYIASQPTPRIYDGGEAFDKPTAIVYTIDFEWAIVEEWTMRLRGQRLIGFNSSDARGGFGGLQLTGLGRLLIEWSRSVEAAKA